MNKSELFTLAHHNTRLIVLKNALLRRKKIKYNIIFKYELKKVINSQPQKVTIYDGSKKINKACAMVGDYKKPTYVRNGYKVTKQINPSLSVTYNLDTLFSLIVSAICVITIYYLALQAIVS